MVAGSVATSVAAADASSADAEFNMPIAVNRLSRASVVASGLAVAMVADPVSLATCEAWSKVVKA